MISDAHLPVSINYILTARPRNEQKTRKESALIRLRISGQRKPVTTTLPSRSCITLRLATESCTKRTKPGRLSSDEKRLLYKSGHTAARRPDVIERGRINWWRSNMRNFY